MMKNEILKISFLIVATLILSLSCSEKGCVEKETDCGGCYEVYDPVCGCNGITYSNSCEAECAGITDYTQGECK